MSLALFLMTEKGHAALEGVLFRVPRGFVSMVVAGRDSSVRNDFFEEIQATCKRAGISCFDRASAPAMGAEYSLAVSWRWMIHAVPNLMALHDSLLPKYRGFAPLPNALINGEAEIGVSALFSSDEYDAGDLILQRRLPIAYPLKVQEAIRSLLPLYADLAGEIGSMLASGASLPRCPQDEATASYSLWRDELDYEIDWSWDADRIKRFIDAVGHPYLGARTSLNREPVLVLDAFVEADVRIENRTPGKVIFVRQGQPVVVCGAGLLRITDMTTPGETSPLPLKKFRSRFGA
jgi:methionyl-tRNA formyltransferase